MSVAIVIPAGYWPVQGEQFEYGATEVQKVNRRFRSVPTGETRRATLERYTTAFEGHLNLATQKGGYFHILGRASRYGWDAQRRCTCCLPLPAHVIISAFQSWNPDFACEALGMPKDSLPWIENPYATWMRLYMEWRQKEDAKPSGEDAA